ncbi:unnamed protein product [Didymodactylos carnosus]|uniref:Amine oxidase n=1 Tax=Didymodactylos carnosus TaxID=1234261 RepID=A0A814ERD5_9BILA|nr:unnamed protein product [Didymodactylos carnosus]CAF0969641.1 unnamed protein product [Didymodactylos carnosus]CAF3540196.1 unnamed protein product [Didymodactylos carnosus]CAF3742815.1 unnamed protein product [Didymodactylos carnosus]
MMSTTMEHDPASEELAAHPSRLPTHPKEMAEERKSEPEGIFSPSVLHPLDPLTANEISLTTKIIQESSYFQKYLRIVTIVLLEPEDKSIILNFQPNTEIHRRVTVFIRDPVKHVTLEMIVDLTKKTIKNVLELTNVQPGLTYDEIIAADSALRSDKNFLAAIAKRNLDVNSIVFYPFTACYRDQSDAASKRRIYRPLSAVSYGNEDNYYAHPIEGLVITVNLDDMTVEIEDHEVVPIPTNTANYNPESISTPNNVPYFPNGVRDDLKPLIITQPDGPSFKVDGYQVTWQKWRFRIGFNVREALVLHCIEYFDKARWRSIIYRAAMSEMYVPYGDASPTHSFKNVFDMGEAGLGLLVNSLVLGCDCLGEIYYFDVVVNNNQGKPVLLKNAICMHEEDAGLLWKHTEFVEGRTQVRRSRRLVISTVATIGNYEYAVYWYLQQDGILNYEVKLTGIIAPAAIESGKTPVSGGLVAPGTYGPYHQHFFNIRIDWMLDGLKNSLVEVNCEPLPPGKANPTGNAWTAKETILSTVDQARRTIESKTSRHWKIVNPSVLNHVGQPVAYKLVSMGNVFPLCQENSSQYKRGGFTRYHLWATVFDSNEMYAAGLYPNQNAGDDGLLSYSEKNKDKSLVESDLVTWYTFGCTHIVRPEDWPVMPVENTGFRLIPHGFFDGNPSLDVPLPSNHCHMKKNSEECKRNDN